MCAFMVTWTCASATSTRVGKPKVKMKKTLTRVRSRALSLVGLVIFHMACASTLCKAPVKAQARRSAVAAWHLWTRSITRDAQQEAIDEMNAEMAELFGSPMGDPSPSLPGQSSMGSMHAPSPNPLHAHTHQPVPTPCTPLHAPESLTITADALNGTIARCTTELQQDPSCLSRSTQLASCIAECARALAALEVLQRPS